jgi:hypothetical protein
MIEKNPLLLMWLILAIINLTIMLISDLKSRLIDDRNNYLMLGLTLSLITIFKTKILYLLALIIIGVLIDIILKKYIGAGDASILKWVVLGLGIISPKAIITFAIILIIYTLTFYASVLISNKINLRYTLPLSRHACNSDKVVLPFLPVLYITFISTIKNFGLI